MSVIVISPRTIDAVGLHVANIDALSRALGGLDDGYDHAWVDGFGLGEGAPPHERLVGGDRRSAAVAAAGVMAKTTRDRLMRGPVAESCPGYGFEAHVGYGTAEHLRALAELGPSPAHRRCFRPVAYTELALFDAASEASVDVDQAVALQDDPRPPAAALDDREAEADRDR